MNNYKTCSATEFEDAMTAMHDIRAGEVSAKSVETELLYIAYSKMDADANHLARIGSTYSLGLSISSRKTADLFREELLHRGAIPDWEVS